jgi:mono/diheme cytochrome c family protein
LGIDLIQQAIRDPRADLPNSIMPRFPLSKGQARKIAYFLKSRVKSPFYATPMQLQAGQIELPEIDLLPPGRELDAGEKLLYRKQCLACHRFREVNGRVAPDLSFAGSLREREYIAGFLERPTRYIPDAVMPQIAMTAAERSLLVDYLVNEARAPEDLPERLAERLGQAEPDKQLFMRLCQSCHAAEGNGLGPLQPNLANFPRAFAGNPEFFRRVEQQRLLHSLEIGIPGTSMPGYGKILTPQQREDLLRLIFKAFIGIAQTDKAQLAALPARPVRTEVAAELFQQRCSRCHGATGTGRGEEALQHLPRPRNLTNRPYFDSIKDERIARAIFDGIAGTAMPAFGQELSAAQLWGLVAKVRQLSKGKE